MKKVLFLIVTLVCAVTGAWAEAPTITYNVGWPFANFIYVSTTEVGTLTKTVVEDIVVKSTNGEGNGHNGDKLVLVIQGPINQSDIDAITAGVTSGPIRVVDYSGATVTGLNVSAPSQVVGLRLPVSEDLTKSYGSNIKYVMSSGMTGLRQHAGDGDQGSKEIYLHVTAQEGVSLFKSHYGGNPSWIQFRNINLSTTVDDLDYSALVHTDQNQTNVLQINPNFDNTGQEYVMPASDDCGCSITYSNGVANVHIIHKSHFSYYFDKIKGQVVDGTRFVFDNQCYVGKEDLLCILKDNKYYVDLFDITNGSDTPMHVDNHTSDEDNADANNIDKIIEAAVDEMVANGYQAKGIILPLNTGSGTSKVERPVNLYSTVHPSFTEYAVYYRETQHIATIFAHDTNIKDTPDKDVALAQSNYETAFGHLNAHVSLLANQDKPETYIVSTNNKHRIDLSETIPAKTTKITIVNDEMVYRETLADIYVKLNDAGDFANAVANTGIKSTPCEKLVLEGDVILRDIEAINEFNDIAVSGPKVFDFNGTTGTTKNMLPHISNGKLEYIILPNALAMEQIVSSDFSESLTNSTSLFKAAIAPSADKKKLSAYVNKAGSLAEARYQATDGSLSDGLIYPAITGLTNVILSGNLNAADIAARSSVSDYRVSADGHWYKATNDQKVDLASPGLNGENTTITSIDLTNAVFLTDGVENSDMNFSYAGLRYINDVKLPTSQAMKTIPANCFELVGSGENSNPLTTLCIPYNYEVIEDGAFWHTVIDHITTTDASGAVIDNKDKTWTLSANIKRLGNTPSTPGVFLKTIFPQNVGIKEIYCLATKVPKCYANVFPANSAYGWSGDDPKKPYSRDRYYNGGLESQAWAVLRFPSRESFNNAAVEMRETLTEADEQAGIDDPYKKMMMLYTDINKNFTKMEQTGAVDANGKAIAWPTRMEANRSYNQASLGLTWNDWKENRDPIGEDGNVAGGGSVNQQVAVGSTYTLPTDVASTVTTQTNPDGDYSFADYIGWHQIVLSQATYVKPDEHVVDDIVYNYYKDAGWYTICIPFDLSYNDVVKMLGVPKSTAKEKSYIVENGAPREAEEADDVMPDIRQLQSVQRTKGEGSADNTILFRLTKNLAIPGEHTAYYLDFNDGSLVSKMPKAKKEGESADNPTCMVGGRPYIIKAYKRVYKNGESFVEETIPSQNIGLYILKHYADDFKESASCLNNEGYCEQLKKYTYELDGSKSKYIIKGTEDGGTTMKFAKPYEDHKVQAVNGGESGGALSFKEGDKTKKYFYTMVGQFWDQDLPQYSVYMSNGKWYRYTDPSKKFKWAAYKCVIMATPEVDQEAINNFTDADLPAAEVVMDQVWTLGGAKPAMPQIPKTSLLPGGNFRDFKNCFFPMNMPDTDDLISAPLKLAFKGRNDHDFNEPGHHQIGSPAAPTRYMFVLDGDEEVVEYDENGNAVTAIATLDGETQGTAGTSKVYNLSGQYVGNSTEGLSKGIYIVDGRKIVVD